MCQLLAMNCNTPTDICFSFEGFCERSGVTDEHKDGWGIAFFEDQACRLFIDTKPAVESPISNLVKSYPIKSLNVIAHIRKASIGKVELANTHPFQRELWGMNWIFAHNGDLWDFAPKHNGRFLPIGTSDSENAFCYILEHFEKKYASYPGLETLYKDLEELGNEIAKFGTFNFLLSNGEGLLARNSTKLCYIVRQAPFAEAHLLDKDYTINFSEHTTKDDRVAIIATEPLTDNETWTHFKEHQLILFKNGELILS